MHRMIWFFNEFVDDIMQNKYTVSGSPARAKAILCFNIYIIAFGPGSQPVIQYSSNEFSQYA